MTPFSITVPVNTIASAFLCLSDPDKDPMPLTWHIYFFDGMCVSTNGRLLLKQRLHDVPEFPPFGISWRMAQVISKNFDNIFKVVEISVTPQNGQEDAVRRTIVRIKTEDGFVLEEELANDFFRVAATLRSGVGIEFKKKSEAVNSDIPKIPFQTRHLKLIGEIGERLNPILDNSVGIEMRGKNRAAVFSINEDAAVLLMPVAEHKYSNVFDVENTTHVEGTANLAGVSND